MEAADQRGLVVSSPGYGCYRARAVEDGWHLLPGDLWGSVGDVAAKAGSVNKDLLGKKVATAQTHFGPGILKSGRMNMVVNIDWTAGLLAPAVPVVRRDRR